MKTLREIQDEVVSSEMFGLIDYNDFLTEFKKGHISFGLFKDINDKCIEEIQRQQQHIINKRVEDDYLNDNFDTSSIINENNIIR